MVQGSLRAQKAAEQGIMATSCLFKFLARYDCTLAGARAVSLELMLNELSTEKNPLKNN
jgi:hypothetical protein